VLFIYLLELRARDQHWTRGRCCAAAQRDTAGVATSVALETFVARENIMRSRRMLEEPQDEAQRQVLLRMLAKAESRLEQLSKSGANQRPQS
jgi:hypothetical protein